MLVTRRKSFCARGFGVGSTLAMGVAGMPRSPGPSKPLERKAGLVVVCDQVLLYFQSQP